MKEFYRNLPDTPGVYFMKNSRGEVLYVGKAGNLKRRVSSYFQKSHEYRIEKLIGAVRKIDYKKTDTALEALILESSLIKKLQPPYNVLEKDDRSFLYVEITKEKFPRVLLVRGKSLATGTRFGPFTSASSIREALKILRRIFPYSTHTNEGLGTSKQGLGIRKLCFDYQIGLCPGTCVGAITRDGYRKNIRNLKFFFEGKKKAIVKNLKIEMRRASKALEFEKAAELRRRIFALQHIQDVAFINDSEIHDSKFKIHDLYRIEGYDISNISGTSAVGSMVVFKGDQPDKNQYRKFKIVTIHQSDDVGMLKEVLRRRFKHVPPASGWALPDLILIDGGLGQVNAARSVLSEAGLRIPVVGIAKGPTRKKNEIVGTIPAGVAVTTLIRARDEAHRFAIRYHRELRDRALVN